jgi:hypothetical protein
MAHPVVTFPQPPPTSNTLTSHQRQQLLRSTRKLTKVLGSAPHLIDNDKPPPGAYRIKSVFDLNSPLAAVYLDLSSKLQSISRSPSLSRRSHDILRPPSPTSSISSVSTTASTSHYKVRFPSRSENNEPQDALDSAFSNKRRPPMLRLASTDDEFSQSVWTRTKLDTVPGSPPAVGDCHSSHHSPGSDASDCGSTDHLLTPISTPTPSVSRSFTLSVSRGGSVPSPFIETSEPVFKVTSEAATRRLKMERIRKRLGECVPVGAVFPHQSPGDEDEDGDYVEVVPEKRPVQVNVDVRPRWKSSSAVVAFDVVYECPDKHGDEGLTNGLGPASRSSKSSVPTSHGNSNTAFPRLRGKLVKRTRSESRF